MILRTLISITSKKLIDKNPVWKGSALGSPFIPYTFMKLSPVSVQHSDG